MLQDIANFRELFLHDINVQARIKAFASNDDCLREAVKIGQENNWNFTVDQLRAALDLYASTGEGGSPTCGPAEQNQPPLSPPTADNLINLVRKTPNGECSW